ncbi:MAG: effector binding domain-containing protein [Clostridiales bacterium]|nr:effector binding domain-containing protein [Clostridiales bacterium]
MNYRKEFESCFAYIEAHIKDEITTEELSSFMNFAEKIRETWKYIFTTWFEIVQYEYDDSREAFEYYDERCHYREDSVMDIYIPLQ